jgi:hypothetical protein
MRLMRGDEQLVAGPHCTIELQDGDVVHIVTGLPISYVFTSRYPQLLAQLSTQSKMAAGMLLFS